MKGGARIINRRPVTMNAGRLDVLDIQREGFKRSEELRRSTGISGKQIARKSADHEFQIWWDYHGAEESALSRAQAKTEWLKGFRGRGWGSDNPYVPIPAPHELFYRAHQSLGGSWDVRRAGYHGKLEILESGLTESKARALAASENAEIRTEREAFFETQPLGSFVAGHNPEWFGYYPRFVPEGLWNELVNLWHLSRVPFSGVREGARYKRMIWTSDEFHKEHPEISSTAVYKDLDGFLAYSGK